MPRSPAQIAATQRMLAARAAKGWPKAPAGTLRVEGGEPIKLRAAHGEKPFEVHSGKSPKAPAEPSVGSFVPRMVKPKPKKLDGFYQPGRILFYSIAPFYAQPFTRPSKEDIKMSDGTYQIRKRGKLKDIKFKNHRYWATPDEAIALRGDEDGPWSYVGINILEALPLEWTVPIPDTLNDQPVQKIKYSWLRSIYEMLDDEAYKGQFEGFCAKVKEKGKGLDMMTIIQEVTHVAEKFEAEREVREARAGMMTA